MEQISVNGPDGVAWAFVGDASEWVDKDDASVAMASLEGPVAWIEWLKSRRPGGGTRTLNALLEKLRDVPVVGLHVVPEHSDREEEIERLARWYRRFGFEITTLTPAWSNFPVMLRWNDEAAIAKNPRFSRAGVAWKPETPVFHATTALQQVLRSGFKTRRALEAEQGVRAQAAGGQHDLSVSFTTDVRVAESICVCLEVVGQLSRRSLQLSKLVWLAQQQLPKAYRSLMMAADFASYVEHADEIDRGWVRRWDSSAYSWGPPRAGEGSEQHKAQYAVYAIEVYTRLLATADQFHEAHNPILFTDPEFASKWNLDNFGIVEARLGLEWVIARPDALVAAGALDRSLLVPFVQDRVQGWVGDAVRELRGHIEGALPDEIYRAQHPLVDRYGRVVVGEGTGVEIVSDVEIDPKTTGEYARGEAEVRVYDPALIRDVRLVATLDDVLAKIGEDRIAYPYFDQYVQPDLS